MGKGIGKDLARKTGMEFNDFEHAPYIVKLVYISLFIN